MKLLRIVIVLLCVIIFTAGCDSEKKSTTNKQNTQMSTEEILNKPLSKEELEGLRQDSLAYLREHPDNINHKLKLEVIDDYIKRNGTPSEQQIMNDVENIKRRMENEKRQAAESERQRQAASQQQLENNNRLPLEFGDWQVERFPSEYLTIEVRFTVTNTSERKISLSSSDFVARKEGYNTAKVGYPGGGMRISTDVNKPLYIKDPPFTLYPGDKVAAFMIFQTGVRLDSAAGWKVFYEYNGNLIPILSITD